MRELYVVEEESTSSTWVLATEDGERFRIPRATLDEAADQVDQLNQTGPATSYEPIEASAQDDLASGIADISEISDVSGGSTAESAEEAGANGEDVTSSRFTVISADDAAPAEPESEQPEPAAPAQTPAPEPQRTPAEPDPLFATPLSLRPKDIQTRIRAGASARELAEEMGVAESRVEPYAHPVLLERAQVAEAAKQSHPVREDGPASDTLFEILALAFAGRGHALSEAEWDAMREPGEPWVVRVSWKAGLQQHEAEWFFRRSMGSAPTTEPRDPVAADLTDPSFAQPVRSLSAVSTGRIAAPTEIDDETEYAEHSDFAHDPDAETYGSHALRQPGPADGEPAGTVEEPARSKDSSIPHDPDADVTRTQPNLFAEGEFLEHPDGENEPRKRRRKAVTPHWEDVLLGVRTNTKRPK